MVSCQLCDVDHAKSCQAYLLGAGDPEYSEITTAVHAILFLATPHDSSDLASVSKLLVRASGPNGKPRPYVTDLMRGSTMIQNLNEAFRSSSRNLQILSFYETLPTQVGFGKRVSKHLVVECQQSY